MNLEDLGYNQYFETSRQQLGWGGFGVARVIAEYKEAYKILNANGEYLAKITGKQMFEAGSREDYPAVGDWVAMTDLGNAQAVIHGVLPRATIIKRKSGDKNKFGKKSDIQIIATNIDIAFIVESVDRDYNLNRFERYFALVQDGGVKPAIVLNKTDLLTTEERAKIVEELNCRFPNTDIILTSIIEEQGLDELKKHIAKSKTYCFLGSSGVGKSSLINKLLQREEIRTGEIGLQTGRGKHTTTARQMYFLSALSAGEGNGGIVIDNPGMREVGLLDAKAGIDLVFDEIALLAKECRYADCTHINESGCAVLAAVEHGLLNKDKYSNFLRLEKERQYYSMDEMEKHGKDKKFGKFLKNTKKQLKDLGHKGF